MISYFIGIIAILVGGIFALVPALKVLFSGETISKTFDFNPLFGSVNFVIDPLSAFFIVVIAVMSVASVVYAKGYLKPYLEKGKTIGAHMVFLAGLIISMILVVTCQNALMFLICWEIMSLSSFFLVIFESEKKEVLRAGIKYLVFMHISVLFIIIAFALCAIKSGSLDFASFAAVLQSNKHLANAVSFSSLSSDSAQKRDLCLFTTGSLTRTPQHRAMSAQ